MARELATSTVERFRETLLAERTRIMDLLDEHEQEREEARLSETSAERSAEPASAEAGSMAFEYEKELSVDQNSADLLRKIERALARIDEGEYGICEICGSAIPVARLEARPYATLCVTCAAKV